MKQWVPELLVALGAGMIVGGVAQHYARRQLVAEFASEQSELIATVRREEQRNAPETRIPNALQAQVDQAIQSAGLSRGQVRQLAEDLRTVRNFVRSFR